MECKQIYLELISGHLDGSNTPAEENRLRQHLQGCRKCRDLLEDLQCTDAALLGETAEVPEELTGRIMEAVRKEAKPRSSKKRFYFTALAGALATAALLALVIFGGTPLQMPDFRMKTEDMALSVESQGSTPAQAEDMAQIVETACCYEPMEGVAAVEVTEGAAETMTERTVSSEKSPAYAAGDELELALPEGNTLRKSSEDGIATGTLPQQTPTLVIWNAEPRSLALPADAQELLPEDRWETVLAREETLYARLLSALPVNYDTRENGGYRLSIFEMDYEALNGLFQDCAGRFELAAYFPAELTGLDSCRVLLISEGQGE